MQAPNRVNPDEALGLPSFRRLYLLTTVVALLVAADLVFWWLGYDALRNPFGVNLSLVAAVLGGARIVHNAIMGLLEGDVGADLALAIAMVAALLLGEYWVAAEVVLIAMVGESLEALTLSRTHREIQRILELRPKSVRLRRGDQELDVPIEQAQLGEHVLIRPGERVPVDGTVLVGRSAVDQSTLTGESLPVDKGAGDAVFAGTLNQYGALEVRIDKVGDDTTLGQVIQLVAQARRNKASVERVADRLARYFLPFVLLMALLTFVVTNYASLRAMGDMDVSDWVWMPTLAVLVVACPCALILATPAAVMAALAWLARRGVLITGGAALERLAGVSRFAFDKTGTLTEGKLELGECVAVDGQDGQHVLRLAAMAEQSSEHLIARAIVRAAREAELSLPAVEDFQALPGAGVSARLTAAARQQQMVEGGRLLVGNRRLMVERNVPISADVDAVIQRLEEAAQTPLLVSCDQQIVGVVGVRDTIRAEAADVIAQLRQLGIEDVVLLTGDRQAAARQVAQAVGIDRYEAELLPEEKAVWLANWSDQSRTRTGPAQPGGIAMVGDGVNDAPALACADVGLALGGVGSDIAAEAGDLILMGDPLAPLPGLLKLSRETVRIIRQNIILFAFTVNFLGIVLTAWIMPSWSETWMARSPVAAALFHQVGSLLVLLNAMRLLWFERWNQGFLARIERSMAGAVGGLLVQLRPLADATRWAWRMRAALLRAGALLLLAAYLTQVVVFVQPDEVAVVQRFGRFRAVMQPGAHLRLPPPWDRITREKPARVRTVEIGLKRVANGGNAQPSPIEWNTPHQQGMLQRQEDEALVLTGDQSLVELAATIQYRVSDVRAYCFAVRQPDRLLKSIAEGTIREVIAAQPLLASDDDASATAEILTNGRGSLEQQIRDRLQDRAEQLQLGIEILPQGVCLQDVHPPLAVVSAFRDVSSAFKEKERMKNEANAYHREKVIKAAGEAAWLEMSDDSVQFNEQLWSRLRRKLSGEAAAEINAARAFASDKELLATGGAASFQFKVAARELAPRLTEWRMFLDTLAEALPGKKKLILDGNNSGRRHLMLGVPQGLPSQLLPLLETAPDDDMEPER